MTQRFNYGLNGLRGLAAISVVIYHSCLAFRVHGVDDAYKLPLDFGNIWTSTLHLAIALFNGPACVTLFFVLSGLVLSLSLARDAPLRGKTIVAYWLKRSCRLYPLLILATIFSAALRLFVFHDETFRSATTWANEAYLVDLTPVEFVKNLIGATSSLNSPAWSIKVEILASIIFPVFFLLSRRLMQALISLTVLLILMFTVRGYGTTIDNISVFAICFFVGALIPRWSKPVADAYFRLAIPARRLIIAFMIIMFCCARQLLSPTVALPPLCVLIEMAASAFIIIIVYHRPAGPIAKSIGARLLGEISYSIYLLHIPVMLTIVHLWLLVRGDPAEMPWLSATIVLLVLTLLVTLPLAYLSYAVFERPIEKAGRQIAENIGRRTMARGWSRPISTRQDAPSASNWVGRSAKPRA